MKVSRYSIFTEISGRFYIYHQLTKSLIEVDKDLFSTLRKGEMNAIDPTMRDELSNMGFLLNEDINEEYHCVSWGHRVITYPSHLSLKEFAQFIPKTGSFSLFCLKGY